MSKINTSIANPFVFLEKVPELWVWAIIFVIYSFLSVLYFQIPINPDDAVFTYIGWVMSDGGTIYVDAADQNWPGQMLIHWLAVLIFGEHIWAFRALEIFVILPLSSLCLFTFTKKIYQRDAAIVVVPLFPLLYMLAGYWNSGQRDLLAGVLFIPACWMLLQRFDGADRNRLIFQGLFIALATLIRPTMLIIGPLLFIADLLLIKQHKRSIATIFFDHCIVGLTIILFGILIVAYGWLSGALSVWHEVSVLFATEVYSQSVGVFESLMRTIPNLLNSWKIYLLAAFAGAIIMFYKNKIILLLLLTIVPAAFISLLVQGKALGYHLTSMYATLSVLMAVGLGFSIRTLLQSRVPLLRFILIFLLLGLTAAILAKKSVTRFAYPVQYLTGKIEKLEYLSHYDTSLPGVLTVAEAYQIAQYIKETTSIDDTVLFWERPTHVNIISGRFSPLREASIALLLEPTEEFSAYSSWYDRIDTVFTDRAPAILLLVKDEKTGNYIGFDQQNPKKGFSSIVIQNLPRYQKERTFGNTDLYRLKNE